MAADLAETAKGDGTTADGEFWYATAAKLLAPLFFAAARDRRSMADVVRWVDTQEASEVSFILEQAGVTEALDAARASTGAATSARAARCTRRRRRFWRPLPVTRPHPVTDAFEPTELLGGCHTLYLCAPAHDQRRLRGYFTALTQQVLSQAFNQATRSREAAWIRRCWSCSTRRPTSHPLPELDGLAATCASHGIQLVTVWQDLAQVRARYGARAPTVLNNHRAKIFLPGIADPDTLEYASRLIGDEEVTTPSVTRDAKGGRSTTSTTRSAPAPSARGTALPAPR